MRHLFVLLFPLLFLGSCTSPTHQTGPNREVVPDRYNVAFLIMDGVYNTELTAPFDIFQHTRYREGIRPMNVFLVANTNAPITTFEGIRLIPDYNYLEDELPRIDILVVPSAEHHLDTDLDDEAMLNFVRQVDQEAQYVTSHCDGAFVLAEAGLLDQVVLSCGAHGCCLFYAGTRRVENAATAGAVVRDKGLAGGLLAIGAGAVKDQAVVGNRVAFFRGDLVLLLFDDLVDKFFHLAAADTDDVVVVTFAVQLEHGLSTLEMVARDQARRLELGEHTVDRRKTDFLTFITQCLVYVLGTLVPD